MNYDLDLFKKFYKDEPVTETLADVTETKKELLINVYLISKNKVTSFITGLETLN